MPHSFAPGERVRCFPPIAGSKPQSQARPGRMWCCRVARPLVLLLLIAQQRRQRRPGASPSNDSFRGRDAFRGTERPGGSLARGGHLLPCARCGLGAHTSRLRASLRWRRPRSWLPVAAAMTRRRSSPCRTPADQASAALSKSDFIAQGDALCAEANAALSALDTGTAGSDPEFQAAQELQITRSELQSLESLPPPSENRSVLDSFLSALEDQVNALSSKKAAVDQGDDPARRRRGGEPAPQPAPNPLPRTTASRTVRTPVRPRPPRPPPPRR